MKHWFCGQVLKPELAGFALGREDREYCLRGGCFHGLQSLYWSICGCSWSLKPLGGWSRRALGCTRSLPGIREVKTSGPPFYILGRGYSHWCLLIANIPFSTANCPIHHGVCTCACFQKAQWVDSRRLPSHECKTNHELFSLLRF